MAHDLINDQTAGIERLLEIMRRLRDPQTGCPWDIEQDFDSIAPYTIEEAYEVADAIARSDWGELEGELGDLLLQTVYHTQMGAEAGHFTFESVVKNIADKMVTRHPHVFGGETRDKSAEEQTADWEKIKAAERAGKDQGGALMTVGATGEIHVVSGGKITDDGTQASHIADVATTGTWADDDDAIIAAINNILAALEGVGILATS